MDEYARQAAQFWPVIYVNLSLICTLIVSLNGSVKRAVTVGDENLKRQLDNINSRFDELVETVESLKDNIAVMSRRSETNSYPIDLTVLLEPTAEFLLIRDTTDI